MLPLWRYQLLALLAVASARDRVVLVTGSARGIGRAIAERHAADGDRVIVHYCSSAEAAEETRLSLPEVAAGAHVCLQADLGAPGAAAALVAEAVARCERLDVLVCNHAIYEETPFEETDAAAWADSFARVLRARCRQGDG